ncbi:MAG: hypothetical protein ACK5LV_11230 [Lachnospirales bacterium]
MEKPYKFTIIGRETKKIRETNAKPTGHELFSWIPTGKENEKKYTQVADAWIDTRYEAKLRLYNYVMRKCSKSEVNNIVSDLQKEFKSVWD